MRSIWKGVVTFGLVNVPIKVYAAIEDHDIPLHQVHDNDGGRIRYQRRCEACGNVIAFEHIDKAYQEGDRTVVITAEDLSHLAVERNREIEIVEFVPNEQLDPLMFGKSYYLEPDSKSNKAYILLKKTLEQAERTAIVHFSFRQKTRLGALRVQDKVLLLQALLWGDEIRKPEFASLDEHVKISERELSMSAELVESFTSDFNPANFTEDYQQQLRELIEAKLAAGDSLDTEATFGEDVQPEGKVLDLMEALKRSIERKKKISQSDDIPKAQ